MLLQVGAACSREEGRRSRFKSRDLSKSRDGRSMASRQRQRSGQVPPLLLGPTLKIEINHRSLNLLLPLHIPGSLPRARFQRCRTFAAERGRTSEPFPIAACSCLRCCKSTRPDLKPPQMNGKTRTKIQLFSPSDSSSHFICCICLIFFQLYDDLVPRETGCCRLAMEPGQGNSVHLCTHHESEGAARDGECRQAVVAHFILR